MFDEYDVVRLRSPLLGTPVPVGAQGTILMIYTHPGIAYEVEFVSKLGKSFGTFTVNESQLEKCWWHAEAGGADV